VLLSNQARVWEVEKKAVSRANRTSKSQLANLKASMRYTSSLSMKRRKSSTNSVKKSKKNDNCSNSSDFKKNRLGENGWKS